VSVQEALSCLSIIVFETSGQPVENVLLQQLHNVDHSLWNKKVGLLFLNHADKMNKTFFF
jgi:ATP-dependent protease Clp ATPase subunit